MRDEYLELFIEGLGEPTQYRPVSQAELSAYRGILPDKLLEYWQEIGWSGFADGLFWLVNPIDYDHLVEMWLEDTPFTDIDRYRTIGRNAFGKMYLWGERTHQTITLNCPMHAIIALESEVREVEEDTELAVQVFLSNIDSEISDIEDLNDKPLFPQALKKLGPLKPDEVYGFEPALIAGGNLSVDNLAILNLDIHLTILRQLGAPQIPFAGVNVNID
ncbi:GAD-like domain-containing protein [Grimontia marina]|uniref:GAD-like domain protein n=1 Tax=Grimontia marina TaxID=646534 RepID=A0A128FK54_9GAMM|nr:GAD-like domain-containing protein [Grimontia marina]CZF86960.1 GAD-like domain protein [Grimontia marina]